MSAGVTAVLSHVVVTDAVMEAAHAVDGTAWKLVVESSTADPVRCR